MGSRAAIVAGVGVLGVAGAYLVMRARAGNDFAKTYPAEEPGVFDWWPLDKAEAPGGEVKSLKYFQASEFGEWWPSMSTELLQKLDAFRAALGSPVMISPAAGSLGRNDGVSLSQHNVELWGEVRAADVMLPGLGPDDLERAYLLAKQVGFTGIGAYRDWAPYVGLHLDVRPGIPGYPAKWAGLKLADGTQSTDFPIERAWA